MHFVSKRPTKRPKSRANLHDNSMDDELPYPDDSKATRPQSKPVESQSLGLSVSAWQAQNKGASKRQISVGGMNLSVPKPAPAQDSAVKPPEATARTQGSAATDVEEYSGRNTKRCYLPYVAYNPNLNKTGTHHEMYNQVLLPTAPDAEVDDSFFERTKADLKTEWRRAREKRELSETLMTRAYREKLAMRGRKVHRFATVRVRFPEGVVLQGCFLPNAMAFEVHAWVQEHLRVLEPFELSSPVLPSKDKKLGHEGSVKDAGLMPTCQLYFRWAPGGEGVDGPALSDSALELTQMEYH